jgi:hypothetical protein
MDPIFKFWIRPKATEFPLTILLTIKDAFQNTGLKTMIYLDFKHR